jgi:hypothetical protein
VTIFHKYVQNFTDLNSKQKIMWADAKATLLDLRLYVHYISYIGVGCLIGSLSLFAPTIVLGLGFEGLRAQLFTVPPYAAAFFCTVAAAFMSDRLRMRGVIVGSSLAVCFISFLILGVCPPQEAISYTADMVFQLLFLASILLVGTFS